MLEKKNFLEENDFEENTNKLSEYSLQLLLLHLKSKNCESDITEFTKNNYKNYFSQFISDYPIIMSTTHALKVCSREGYLYDYLIIDESSQVDIATAILAMSCAKNLVLVGDLNQLPHIVPDQKKIIFEEIFKRYNISNDFDYSINSILASVKKLYGKSVPIQLLREHYRCSPEIIEFCNKKFYNNQLIILNSYDKDKDMVKVITNEPYFDIGRMNERQVDIIEKEIMPLCMEDLGVIAPYRRQVELLNDRFAIRKCVIDTIHKFQGRERDTIIISTVSDIIKVYEDETKTDFLNDSRLLNVAISRAKHQLFLVVSSEIIKGDGILADLAKYINYSSSNSEVIKTKVYSVFDLLHEDYNEVLNELSAKLSKESDYKSENIIATIMKDILKEKQFNNLKYCMQYPLRKLIDTGKLDNIDDRNFVLNTNSHSDFVIYNKFDKKPILTIEVDGRQHLEEVQKARDKRKDRILETFGISTLRLTTRETDCKKKIIDRLILVVKKI